MDEATLDEIQKNADYIVAESQTLSGFRFGFDEKSVHWLAGYIEDAKASGEVSGDPGPYVDVLGSYLGEAVRHCFGGTWEETADGLAVQLPWGVCVYPFTAVERQILNGVEDSVTWVFTSLKQQQQEHQPAEDGSLLGKVKNLFGR